MLWMNLLVWTATVYYLTTMCLPMQEAKEVELDAAEDGYLSTSRAAVLADAEALLTCYGVGDESGAELLHAVVELCFTSSVRFLQPGLLLKVSSQRQPSTVSTV